MDCKTESPSLSEAGTDTINKAFLQSDCHFPACKLKYVKTHTVTVKLTWEKKSIRSVCFHIY